MALYKFVKQFGNKKAGETYPLLPVAAKALLSKGIVEIATAEKPVKKEKTEKEPAKRGRKKSK